MESIRHGQDFGLGITNCMSKALHKSFLLWRRGATCLWYHCEYIHFIPALKKGYKFYVIYKIHVVFVKINKSIHIG